MDTTYNKMQWFIDKYNYGILDYYIYDSGFMFGSVRMPTGTGKSGVIYADIVKRIDTHDTKRKLVFNISCPLLKLTQQLASDLFDVIKVIYKDKLDKFILFINSSDSGNKYNKFVEGTSINIESIKNIGSAFINDSKAEIAIIMSCHKSMDQFILKYIKKMSTICDIYSYIDESHLISPKRIKDDTDKIVFVNLARLCKYSMGVYALSATSTRDVVEFLNNLEYGHKEKYLYHLSPIQAIKDGKILPPYVNYRNAKDGITADICIQVMNHAKRQNPNIVQKILVTVKDTNELSALQKALRAAGHTVFSTCSAYGYDYENIDEEGNAEYENEDSNIVTFINAISNCADDCFVLHIKQLIQGIDISSLTGCIIWENSNANIMSYRHIIQTIGRTLRVMPADRNVEKSKRLKQYGNVYFITSDSNTAIIPHLQNFIAAVYGMDNVLFEDISGNRYKLNNDTLPGDPLELQMNSNLNSINELRMNIQSTVDNLIHRINTEKQVGAVNRIHAYITNLANTYMNQFTNNVNTVEFLTDTSDIVKMISDCLRKNGIEY